MGRPKLNVPEGLKDSSLRRLFGPVSGSSFEIGAAPATKSHSRDDSKELLKTCSTKRYFLAHQTLNTEASTRTSGLGV